MTVGPNDLWFSNCDVPLVEAFYCSSSLRPSALRDWIMLDVLLFGFLASQALGYTYFSVSGPWFSHFWIVFNFFLASCKRSEVSMFAYAFILSSCISLAASVVRLCFFPCEVCSQQKLLRLVLSALTCCFECKVVKG